MPAQRIRSSLQSGLSEVRAADRTRLPTNRRVPATRGGTVPIATPAGPPAAVAVRRGPGKAPPQRPMEPLAFPRRPPSFGLPESPVERGASTTARAGLPFQEAARDEFLLEQGEGRRPPAAGTGRPAGAAAGNPAPSRLLWIYCPA
jgi:hypothetical protein